MGQGNEQVPIKEKLLDAPSALPCGKWPPPVTERRRWDQRWQNKWQSLSCGILVEEKRACSPFNNWDALVIYISPPPPWQHGSLEKRDPLLHLWGHFKGIHKLSLGCTQREGNWSSCTSRYIFGFWMSITGTSPAASFHFSTCLSFTTTSIHLAFSCVHEIICNIYSVFWVFILYIHKRNGVVQIVGIGNGKYISTQRVSMYALLAKNVVNDLFSSWAFLSYLSVLKRPQEHHSS